MSIALRVRWGLSRGASTFGWRTCSLFADGRKVAGCNGGGYDMRGTVFGTFIAEKFADRLRGVDKPFFGLSFHDPNFDPGKAVIDGRTVAEREAAGDSLGLERYQTFHAASSPVPTARHTVPLIDGGCGFESVERIARAAGLAIVWDYRKETGTIGEVTE